VLDSVMVAVLDSVTVAVWDSLMVAVLDSVTVAVLDSLMVAVLDSVTVAVLDSVMVAVLDSVTVVVSDSLSEVVLDSVTVISSGSLSALESVVMLDFEWMVWLLVVVLGNMMHPHLFLAWSGLGDSSHRHDKIESHSEESSGHRMKDM
jgi:hypothetical protein